MSFVCPTHFFFSFPMHAIRRFFATVIAGFSRPAAFRDFRSHDTGGCIGFLYLLLTMAAFVLLLFPVSALWLGIPVLRTTLVEGQREVAQLYPENLVLTLSGGILQTNTTGAVVINFPSMWNKFVTSFDENLDGSFRMQHLLTIDTAATVEDYQTADSLVLMTRDSFVAPDRNRGGLKVYPYPGQGQQNDVPFVFNHEKFVGVMDAVAPFIDKIPSFVWWGALLLLLIGPFIGGAFMLLWYLIYLLLAAVGFLLIGVFAKHHLTYGEAYRLALHALPVPLLYQLFARVVGLHVPFGFSLVLLLWGIVIVRSLPTVTVKRKKATR